jgi:Flp pilus assembly pilin Flp
MNSVLLSLYTGIQQWILREEGQDLIEYALIAALLSIGATFTISNIGADVTSMFNFILSDI